MSNRSQVNENSPIAGEPANNPALKTVPPLDGQVDLVTYFLSEQ